MELQEILSSDITFRYRLLGRMQSDCETSINYRYLSHLWGITVETHIKYMKAIYNSFNANEKPVWISMEKINMYNTELLRLI